MEELGQPFRGNRGRLTCDRWDFDSGTSLRGGFERPQQAGGGFLYFIPQRLDGQHIRLLPRANSGPSCVEVSISHPCE